MNDATREARLKEAVVRFTKVQPVLRSMSEPMRATHYGDAQSTATPYVIRWDMTSAEKGRRRALNGAGTVSQSSTGHSTPPPGVRQDADLSSCPSKTHHPEAHYVWHIKHAAKAGDLAKIERLVSLAEKDAARYTGEVTSTASERHDDAARELEDYEGYSAEDAAFAMGTDVTWVRKQRVLAGRDVEYGRRIKLSERKRKIVALALEGKTQPQIATAVGCKQPYVSQVLNGHA